MRSTITKLYHKEDAVMQWHMQAGNITTNIRVKIFFTLPELSAVKPLIWNSYVDHSAKVRYNMNLCRDLLTAIGLNQNFSDHVINAYY